ncbi:MAG TPA: class I SAM-dependent methyltransferase, partial [Dermatophilaceae bacterium]|nr:class I SAM-dependent methyltransferase [Dermatophilaceae bacterium]
MSAQKPASWAYSEEFITETEVIEKARARGEELGCAPVMPGAGAALRLLAAAVNAKAVVEVGTGAGVSGLWLMSGMPSDGILTTIDVEAEHQRAARAAYASAGIASQRTRVITGRGLDVLPRLTDGAYDMVVIDAEKTEYPLYVEQALRLLAAAAGAKAVVEVGTGAGVSGLWLMSGMPSDGILTTIDVEAEHQRAA